MRHILRHHGRTSLCIRGFRRDMEADRRAVPQRAFGRSADPELALLNGDKSMIRVTLPYHLRTLAQVDDDVQLELEGPVTISAVLDAIEAKYPVLRGTIRFHENLKRRPWIRFYACEEDLSHEPHETVLPDAVASGKEPFMIVGAIAGG